MQEKTKRLKRMIGKTDRNDPDKWLPFWMHSYDTAGVMEYLYDEWISPSVKRIICGSMDEEHGRKLCLLLAYTHDVGKLSYHFQSFISDNANSVREKLAEEGMELSSAQRLKNTEEMTHSLIGEAILRRNEFPVNISIVVGSHHGKTPDKTSDSLKQKLDSSWYYGEQKNLWKNLWEEWIAISLEQSGFSSIAEIPDIDMKTQVILTGLLIMDDWIASNQSIFPTISVESAGTESLYPQRVQHAMQKLDLPEFWIPGEMDYGMNDEVFQERFGFPPRKVQQEAMQIAENTVEPGIIILEAQMGVGKTEAALAIAEILGRKAESGGIFFGLPTQATANGLFPRLVKWGEQQSEEVKLGIRLAHGATELNEDYQKLLEESSSSVGEDENTSLIVHSWFESKKVALLADFVIGTVDQFLMAALKQKHVMLRHLGLAGKVVIIDECHAYDAYMNQFLDCALSWMGAYQVPVIILSATLPQERRRQLIQSYLNQQKPDKNAAWCTTNAYPLFTWTDAGKVYQKYLKLNEAPVPVQLYQIRDEDVVTVLKQELVDGGCVGVILNTVQRAEKFAEQLQKNFPEYEVIVFHAQFLVSERAELETKVLKCAGKTSEPEGRKHLMIVGTQVLEQSLDLDFDILITDLCPMDLLLQRIGREHRHKGRIRQKHLQNAKCYVLMEDILKEDKFIYDKWLLKRTLQKLPEQILLPDSIPELVQSVYAEPDDAEKNELWDKFVTDKKKMRQKAKSSSVLSPSYGKGIGERFNSIMGWINNIDAELTDAQAQATVRMGDPSIEVLVFQKKEDGIYFLPWQYGGQKVSSDCIPSKEECARILQQRLRLSSFFSKKWMIDTVIQELKIQTATYFSEWKYSPKLSDELILLLDENLTGTLCKKQIRYDRKLGLLREE